MDQQVTEISSFKFDSLRKYMHPIYSRLNRNLHESKERKKEILHDTVPDFYRRMRAYRGLSLDEVAGGSGFSAEELGAFETKRMPPNFAMEMAYCKACGGHLEFEFFAQQAHEFFHPTVKESKLNVAEAALKQWGIKIPGVDYKSLHAPKGKILELVR